MAKALANQWKIILSSKLTDTEGLAAQKGTVAEDINNVLTTVATSLLYTTTGTISGGSNDIDLSSALEDPIGDTIVFAKVMAIFIRNNGANAMTIGGTNNIPLFANTSPLGKEAYFSHIDQNGITVTAGTGDLITIAGTNGDTYDIIVVGAP